ncbi:MAG: site-2 protease family protein [Sphingomonadales bacterium]|nr:site-2 protease family protein [Sphingomonadales bacterium]
MEIIAGLGTALYTTVVFIIALSVIVTVHEYGHYIVGRWSGIKAEVFSLGFGPTLFSRTDRHGTRWQVAAFPLGGYVKFLGDANAASAGADTAAMAELSAEERRHTMHGAPLWARAATVAAGPVFNFILSIAVFAALIMWTGTAVERPTVGAVVALPGGAGELRAGDVILSVEGQEVADYPALDRISDALPSQDRLRYGVERDGARLEITGPPPPPTAAPGTAAA